MLERTRGPTEDRGSIPWKCVLCLLPWDHVYQVPQKGEGRWAPGVLDRSGASWRAELRPRAPSRQVPRPGGTILSPIHQEEPQVRVVQGTSKGQSCGAEPAGSGLGRGRGRGGVQFVPMTTTWQTLSGPPTGEPFSPHPGSQIAILPAPAPVTWDQGVGSRSAGPLGGRKACGQKGGPLGGARCPGGAAACLLLPLCLLRSIPWTQLALLFCLFHFFIYMFAFPLHIWFPSAQD